MNPPDHREWHRLFSAAFDDQLSDADKLELAALLKSNAEARQLWFLYTDNECSLAERKRPTQINTRRTGRSWLPWRPHTAAAAAAVMAVVTVAVFFLGGLRRGERVTLNAVSDYAATLVAQADCKWSGGAQQTGTRLAPGRLRLETGRAVVHFDGGARMVIVGPARVLIEAAGAARIEAGEVAVRAPEEAAGFRVTTPEGVAVDLGTEFVVNVGPQGQTECRVIEGEVEWRSTGDKRSRMALTQGQARRFHAGKEEALSQGGQSFSDLLPAPAAARAGELLAYEPFVYAEGLHPAEQLAGGSGWASAWRGGRYVAGKFTDVDPQMRIVQGAWQLSEERHWRLRVLPQAVKFGEDGVYYFAFVCQRLDAAKAAGVLLDLRSTQGYMEHLISFRITADEHALIVADGSNERSDEKLTTTQPLLVVGKIATSRDGPDQMFMKVYQASHSPDAGEPQRWTVTGQPFRLDAEMPLLILGTLGGTTWSVDDLRYGTSWPAVMPSFNPQSP